MADRLVDTLVEQWFLPPPAVQVAQRHQPYTDLPPWRPTAQKREDRIRLFSRDWTDLDIDRDRLLRRRLATEWET